MSGPGITPYRGHGGPVWSVAYAPDGATLAIALLVRCRIGGPGIAQNISERIVCSKGVVDSFPLRGAKLPFDPYVQEHMDMVNSILGKGPYLNEAMEVAQSTMTAIMGREAAYSGMKITWDMIMNSQEDLLPKSFDYKDSLPVPPLPVPGQYKFV